MIEGAIISMLAVTLLAQMCGWYNYYRQRREYYLIKRLLEKDLGSLREAQLQKAELIESQQTIEQGIDRGTTAIEAGHHLLRNLSKALAEALNKDTSAVSEIEEKASAQFYEKVRWWNKQINQVASHILKELPHRPRKND